MVAGSGMAVLPRDAPDPHSTVPLADLALPLASTGGMPHPLGHDTRRRHHFQRPASYCLILGTSVDTVCNQRNQIWRSLEIM